MDIRAAPTASSTSSCRCRARGASAPNPEQLFAAGWSACFESAIGIAAHRQKLAVPEIAIDAEVDLHLADGEYFISARFNISLPGLERDTAQSLIEDAERICTYSKATRGNIDVVFNVV